VSDHAIAVGGQYLNSLQVTNRRAALPAATDRQLMQTPARSIPSPYSCNSSCEISVRGSRSSRLAWQRRGAGALRPPTPADFHIIAAQRPCVGRSWGDNLSGKQGWGIGDVSLGRYAGHQRRLVAPPLSTGAALHAWPGAEVVRASRPISPFELTTPDRLRLPRVQRGCTDRISRRFLFLSRGADTRLDG
jgi:hypothetical protein